VLFKTELVIVDEYIENNCQYCEEDEEYEYDKDEFIKPGMTFTMNYTHTRNYASEDACIPVTVVSISTIIDDGRGIYILGCVLKTENPIYVCESGAILARGISLHTETSTIASGCVQKILK